jgi:AraC family transcriptional regulator
MKHRIELLSEKKLIGIRMRMSLSDNKTAELWRTFMLRRKEVKNNINIDLFSIQLYDTPLYFSDFNPDASFDKFAAVEVSTFHDVPSGMERLVLNDGLYAVFIHKGTVNEAPKTFQYIFGTWLPNSAYFLDDRPHFEILGEKYKDNSPDSEEEIWIPIKLKYT